MLKNKAFNHHTFYRFDLSNLLQIDLSEKTSSSFTSDVLPKLSGWYMFEIKAHSSYQLTNISVSFDFGKGFKAKGHQKLLLTNNKEQKRLLLLRGKASKIRITLDNLDKEFEITQCKLIKVSQSFALNRMQKKLGLPSEYNRHSSLAKLWFSYSKYFRNNYNSSYLVNLQPSYQNWISVVEKLTFPNQSVIENCFSLWLKKPLISIVLPTYNTPPKYLIKCIESVTRQVYENWELCISDDASTNKETLSAIESFRNTDSRIKIHLREENGHISKATNSAIAIAKGEYIALLDHDDMLSKYALFYIVDKLNQEPNSKIIYSDEDWIDEEGIRITPHFKSDWNPDLFFSHNYITHLAVYDAKLLKKVKGLRVGVEGSQDYDLILRCLPHVKSNEIKHIPRVLYHWRAIEGSTALDSGEKSYTVEAGRKSLKDYFENTNQRKVTVEASVIDNTYRVRWPIPKPEPKVTLIIPTRDMKAILEVAISSILEKTSYLNYQIVIVDNGSSKVETLNYFKDLTRTNKHVSILKYDYEFNYSAINNYAVANTESDIIGLVNNDIEVINSEWLTEMVSHALRSDIGCVGAKLYYPDESIQHAGIIMGLGGGAAHSHRHFPREHPGYIGRLKMVQNLSGVTGACLLVKRSTYNEVGGLDQENLKIAYNDVDFCLKVREAGYRNLWTPFAELYHYESVSRGYEDSPEKIARFKSETEFLRKKWGNKLLVDPYYNKNLTQVREDFSIGFDI